MYSHRKLITLITVAALAAVVFFSTIVDFLPCGDALHRAVGWAGLAAEPERIGPLWGWLVRWCNCRATPMGRVSAIFGMVNAVLVAYIGWCLFPVAVASARKKHTTGHHSSRFFFFGWFLFFFFYLLFCHLFFLPFYHHDVLHEQHRRLP